MTALNVKRLRAEIVGGTVQPSGFVNNGIKLTLEFPDDEVLVLELRVGDSLLAVAATLEAAADRCDARLEQKT